MSVSVNAIISNTVDYLTESVTAEKLKFAESDDPQDLTKLMDMIADLGFQTDFSLMKSAVEVQEVYDIYRNRPAEESNLEIRLLLSLSSHIYNILMDEFHTNTNMDSWETYLSKLAKLITLHSRVDVTLSCQDESLLTGMDYKEWKSLLTNNPWLVAAVTIQYIPSYYLTTLLLGLPREPTMAVDDEA